MPYHPNFVFGDRNVQVPAHLNFGEFMLYHIRQWNDNVALVNADTDTKLTYKEIAQYIVNLSSSLKYIGVQRGDTVALGSEKRIEIIPTVLAIVLTGATYTLYSPKGGRASIEHQLSIAKPKYFIYSQKFWAQHSNLVKKFDCIQDLFSLEDNSDGVVSIKTLASKYVDMDLFEPTPVQGQIDTAILLYSSGTTGMPKGVQLTHMNSILNSTPPNFSHESLHTVYMSGEWYHNYHTFITYIYFVLGKRIVYDNVGSPEAILQTVERYKVDIAYIVPSTVYAFSKMDDITKYKLESLQIIYSRSCPLHVKAVETLKSKLPNLKHVMQGYGMTEAGELTSEFWGEKGPKPGSVGKASPGIILKVVNPETRQILGPNCRGEICLKGPVFMKGYVGIDPSIYLDDDGFFKTGDLGYYDEDKYFYIVDRIKEVISFIGFQVSPTELETVIQLHPAVKEVGVVGKPDPELDELPAAFVVKRPGFHVTEQDIVDFIVEELPEYMELKGGVRFIDELPKNPRGKILRRVLREMF